MKRQLGYFVKLTDAISFGMGTPQNISGWLLVVAIWFALAGFFPKLFVPGTPRPSFWQVFTSTAWNFPLNTVTTLAELYIGFLVAAAANRSERHLFSLLNEEEGELSQLKRATQEHQVILEELHDFSSRTLTELAEINNNLNSPALASVLRREQKMLDASRELQGG